MREFSIRPAGVGDAETIHRFIRALAEFEREPAAVRTTPEVIAAQLASANPPFEAYLAEQHGVPVGFALFFQNYSTWLGRPGLYLEDLFVLPEHRGRGVGRALFALGARLVVERGWGRYEWAALNWNHDAIEFYRRFDAEPLGDWTTFRLAGEALRRAASG